MGKTASYLLAAIALVGAAIFFGANVLLAEGDSIGGLSNPPSARAPEPVSKSVAERLHEAEEKAAQDKARLEKAAGEKDKGEAEKETRAEARAKADKEARKRAAAERRAAARQAAAERAAAERAAAQGRQSRVARATPDFAPAPASDALSMTIPKIGRYNDPVYNSIAESVLANGAGKLPSSGFPWQPGANTYIAAHVYGYPGTGSWQQFADLPSMAYGDEIYLTDANGTTYTYRVTEVMTVSPYDVWVTAPTGQDMVTLQTCTGPGWNQRLIVRGVRVA